MNDKEDPGFVSQTFYVSLWLIGLVLALLFFDGFIYVVIDDTVDLPITTFVFESLFSILKTLGWWNLLVIPMTITAIYVWVFD